MSATVRSWIRASQPKRRDQAFRPTSEREPVAQQLAMTDDDGQDALMAALLGE